MSTEQTTAAQFDAEIKQKIPIIREMGASIVEFNSNQVKLSVLFEPNKNHVNTVFGGSLYSVCALACYGLFRAMAESSGFTEEFLVIQDGSIQYLKPVQKNFQVVATKASDLDLDHFIESVRRQKKGRLELQSQILQDGVVCAQFRGRYVMRTP